MGYVFTHKELNILSKALNPRICDVNKNEVLANMEDGKNTAVIVIEGLIYLCNENYMCERHIINFFRKGEFFSGNMLYSHNDDINYFISKGHSKIAYFDKDRLYSFCISSNMEALCLQLERCQLMHSLILQQKTIQNKLLYFFINESKYQNSNKIKLPMPYSDLADYISSERTAMMKEISKMKNKGIISGKNHSITLNYI